MKLEKRDFIEGIGLLSVVLSLLFVGQQLRLDRSLALAEQYSSRAESMKTDIRTRMESDIYLGNMALSWDRGNRPAWWNNETEEFTRSLDLSTDEISMQFLEWQLLYYQDDNLYFQYLQGLLSEEFWIGVRANLEYTITQNPIKRGVYSDRRIERAIDKVIRELLAEN